MSTVSNDGDGRIDPHRFAVFHRCSSVAKKALPRPAPSVPVSPGPMRLPRPADRRPDYQAERPPGVRRQEALDRESARISLIDVERPEDRALVLEQVGDDPVDLPPSEL